METIKKVQTKNYIADLLRNEIFYGNMRDGEKLTQEAIAKKLGVSRMPVREALQLLEQEGFLRRLPNRHICVNGINLKSILYNFRILSSLETEITRMVLQEDKDITPIEKAFSNLKTAQNDKFYVEKVVSFHRQISVQLGDPHIQSLHQKIMAGYFTFALNHLPNHCHHSLEALTPIVKAIQIKEEKNLHNKFNEYFETIAYAMIKEGNSE